jgi:hypothetical protein
MVYKDRNSLFNVLAVVAKKVEYSDAGVQVRDDCGLQSSAE